MLPSAMMSGRPASVRVIVAADREFCSSIDVLLHDVQFLRQDKVCGVRR